MFNSAIEQMTIEKWKLTKEDPTVDFNSLVHTFSTIGSRNTVTLTQLTQIDKVANYFFPDNNIPPTYLALMVRISFYRMFYY